MCEEIIDEDFISLLKSDLKFFINIVKPAAAVKVDLGNGLIALVGKPEDIRKLLDE